MYQLVEEIEFMLAFSPILIGHLVVPPISYYLGAELPPGKTDKRLLLTLVKELIYVIMLVVLCRLYQRCLQSVSLLLKAAGD
jgi:hypothetical protein